MNLTDHRATLLHQFTLQAAPFAELGAHAADAALGLFVELGQLAPSHRILDAGCGPGLLVCHLAPHVAHVTGVDVTRAMLDEAQRRVEQSARENVTLLEGDMLSLPFPDGAFDRVCTRFTFHHVPDAARAFRELVRVTKPGGRLILMDAAPPARARDAYDRVEAMRDPSHVRALTLEELVGLGERAGLGTVSVRRFGLPIDLEKQLAASFPEPGVADELRRMLRDDVGHDTLGFSVRAHGDDVTMVYPIAVLAWDRQE